MNYLSSDVIHRLLSAAVSCHLEGERDALLGSMDRAFVAQLKKASSHKAQLMMDLATLNRRETVLEGGTVPLRVWLNNAKFLAYPQQEGAVFSDALDELERVLGDEPPRPQERRDDPPPTRPPQPPIHPLEAVSALLSDLFRETGRLRRFLQHIYGARFTHDLPGNSSPLSEVAAEAAEGLERRGLLNEDLFDALTREFPQREVEILQVRTTALPA